MTCEITTKILLEKSEIAELQQSEISVEIVSAEEIVIFQEQVEEKIAIAEPEPTRIAILQIESGIPCQYPLNIEIGPDFFLMEAAFNFSDNEVLIASIPAGAVIKGYGIYIFEIFTNPLATISIGDDNNNERVLLETENQPGRLGSYFVEWEDTVVFDTDLKVYLKNAVGSGRGKASILYKITS